MIWKAFRRAQKNRRRLYGALIAIAALSSLIAGGLAYRRHKQLQDLKARAEAVFYQMKQMDVQIAGVEKSLIATGRPQDQEQVRRYLEQRRQLEDSYERYVSTMSDRPMTPEQQLILRVTRRFGECDIAAPPEYLSEVAAYIRKWRATGRFAAAVNRARERGYTKLIAAEFERQDLPPQFFYLAMQESSFDETAVGPRTSYGFPKGMWMFIPETGWRYGLTIGPLAGLPRPDVADDRHHWEKATRAAATYIKDIYSTDAQASGLLVMASYNWGERRVVDLIKTLPRNPRERNFWTLLQRYRDKIPKYTYDYVFYIVSAAVIGENPRLFGFEVDSPLAINQDQVVSDPVSRPSPATPAASLGSEETAVALFLSGDYARAADILTAPRSGSMSPRAYFYFACSRAALVITRQLDQSALVDARVALTKAGGAAKFPADLPYISPRILQALEAKAPR